MSDTCVLESADKPSIFFTERFVSFHGWVQLMSCEKKYHHVPLGEIRKE